MRKVLRKSFFNRPTLLVARDLLGKYLVRRVGKKEIALMITETESYDGFMDLASKASRGRTPGNEPMFMEAGTIYVYFTYGMHWLINIVTREENYPAAVLLRGAGDIIGPARLTKALSIDRTLNKKFAEKKTGLWIEDRGVRIIPQQIMRTPRIGIDSSGPLWREKKYRFLLKREGRRR